MTYEILNRLLHQIKNLRELNARRAHGKRVLAAMRECIGQIERLGTGDMAAQYAGEIRTALDRPARLSHTTVGGQIDHLVAYVLIVAVAILGRSRGRRSGSGPKRG